MVIDQPGNVTDKIILLGRRESCVYLLKGQNEYALLGGGMVTIVPDMLEQIEAFKIDENKIRRMIILHNHLSKVSREFVEAYGTGNTVISWYEGGREAWIAAGGTDKVSAFPSVIVDVPEHVIPERLGANDQTLPEVSVPAHQATVRIPRDLADVQAHLDNLNKRLAGSAAAGRPVPPLTLGGIDRSQEVVARMSHRPSA